MITVSMCFYVILVAKVIFHTPIVVIMIEGMFLVLGVQIYDLTPTSSQCNWTSRRSLASYIIFITDMAAILANLAILNC